MSRVAPLPLFLPRRGTRGLVKEEWRSKMATIIDIEGFFSRRGIRMFDVWLNSTAGLVAWGSGWFFQRVGKRKYAIDIKKRKRRRPPLQDSSFSTLDGSRNNESILLFGRLFSFFFFSIDDNVSRTTTTKEFIFQIASQGTMISTDNFIG